MTHPGRARRSWKIADEEMSEHPLICKCDRLGRVSACWMSGKMMSSLSALIPSSTNVLSV